MKYMGSKARHTKYILPIILENRKSEQWYVEPFVGGFNLLDKVNGLRIANDSNFYLIELFKAIQEGWIPPNEISEIEYREIKQNKEQYPNFLVGFVGIGCSFSGKWFGGYARGTTNTGKNRNYCNESKRNILKQAEKIKDVVIKNENYWDLKIPDNSIIYCDPPYAKTTKYKDSFNTAKFWDWVRLKHREGHSLFISEYNAPNDFECIWSKQVNNTLVQNTGAKQGIEKLFKSKIGN